MQTSVRTPQSLFMMPQRLQVSLFQSPYVWNKELHWEPFWRDIEWVSNRLLSSPDKSEPHFLGAIVLQQTTTMGDVTEYAVVDGKQRLSTLSTLLDALYAQCMQFGAPASAGRLEELVEHMAAYCKLPKERYEASSASLMHAREYFDEGVATYIQADGASCVQERAGALERTVRELLQIVVIELGADDSVQEVLDMLNKPMSSSVLAFIDEFPGFIDLDEEISTNFLMTAEYLRSKSDHLAESSTID